MHWLKGKNGTGKSTLFRLIAGETPFDGEVELNGTSLKKQPILFRSKISFAEAEPQYPSFITGNDLIDFYQKIRKADKEEAKHLADYFEMTAFLNNKLGGYSSGMLKKLSLICAFLGNPDLYMLDEPLITIDNDATEKLYQLIDRSSSKGKIILLSSHQDISNDKIRIDTIYQIADKQIIAL